MTKCPLPKCLLPRIDTVINGIRYKTVPDSNTICSSDGKMYRYTLKSTFRPFNLVEKCVNHKNSNGYGYLQGSYRDQYGRVVQTSKHRIIAYAFGLIDTIHSPLDVGHKNKIADDNRLENLEASPHKEALIGRDNFKPVIATEAKVNGKSIEFKSIISAAQYLIENNISKSSNISSVQVNLTNSLKEHKNNIAYGYFWTYKEV